MDSFQHMLLSSYNAMEQSSNPDLSTDLNLIRDALAIPRSLDFKPGDLVVQRLMPGAQSYRSKNKDKPVIFVRYLSDAEQVAVNMCDNGETHINSRNAVISYQFDTRDGEVVLHVIDTRNYEAISYTIPE